MEGRKDWKNGKKDGIDGMEGSKEGRRVEGLEARKEERKKKERRKGGKKNWNEG